jgi:hypothetical protein
MARINLPPLVLLLALFVSALAQTTCQISNTPSVTIVLFVEFRATLRVCV